MKVRPFFVLQLQACVQACVSASCQRPTKMTMKQLLPLALFTVLLLAGCARHYTITLNSGNRITTLGKPRLEHGSYVFKDAKGQESRVSAGRVREVAPSNMTSSRSSSGFSATPTN